MARIDVCSLTINHSYFFVVPHVSPSFAGKGMRSAMVKNANGFWPIVDVTYRSLAVFLAYHDLNFLLIENRLPVPGCHKKWRFECDVSPRCPPPVDIFPRAFAFFVGMHPKKTNKRLCVDQKTEFLFDQQ